MTILITGASRGIGRALFDGFVARDQAVLGTTRGAREGDKWLSLDVTDPQAQARMAKDLSEKPIELLICNAGVFPDKGHDMAGGYPAQIWADSFATNVTGVFLTVQNLLPNLRLASHAKIAIISSKMASDTLAPGGAYIYRASKAAALNLGRNLASDLKAEGIAVGIYHPGWVKTDMGGDGADISVAEAAAGLSQRFEALSLATTGCFESFDGQSIAF